MINIFSTSYNKPNNILSVSLSNLDYICLSAMVRVFNPKTRQFRDFKFDKQYDDGDGNVTSLKYASPDGIALLIYLN